MNRCKTFTVLDSPLKENTNNAMNHQVHPTRRPGQSLLVISPPKKPEPVLEEPEQTPIMLLKQFQAKESIDFKKVLLNNQRTMYLVLRNPSMAPQDVTFEKHPNAEKGFKLAGDSLIHVTPKSEVKVGFVWEPTKEGRVFDSCALLTSDGHKLQVNLTGDCVLPPKPIRKGPNRRRAINKVGSVKNNTMVAAKAKLELERKKQAVKVIETAYTKYKIRKACKAKFELQRKAVNTISVAWITYKKRQLDLYKRKRAVIVIENAWLLYLGKKQLARRKQAVSVIENAWLRYLARITAIEFIKRELERKRQAVKIIETAYMNFKIRQSLKARLELEKKAVETISVAWMLYKKRQSLKAKLELEKKAVETISLAWLTYKRRQLEMRKRRQAALVIENAWLHFSAKKLLERQKRAVSVIENAWLRYVAKITAIQLIRRELERRRQAVKVIENAYKRLKIRQLLKAELELQKKAVETISVAWLTYKRRQLEKRKRKHAVHVIENVWLNYKSKKAALELLRKQEKAARVIENAWIIFCAKRKYKMELELRKTAVKTIEVAWLHFCFRRRLALKLEKLRIAKIKRRCEAVQVIENAWLNYKARKAALELLRKREKAARIIENAWIRFCANRKREMELERRKLAVRVIENAWLNYCSRRRMAIELEEQRIAVMIRRCEAVQVIENAWLSFKSKKAALELLRKQEEAALELRRQQEKAALELRRQQEKAALELLRKQEKAARIIENAWMKFCDTRRIQMELERQKSAVEIIEEAWLRYCSRKAAIELENQRIASLRCNSVKVIERSWLSYCCRKSFKLALRKLKAEAVVPTTPRTIVSDEIFATPLLNTLHKPSRPNEAPETDDEYSTPLSMTAKKVVKVTEPINFVLSPDIPPQVSPDTFDTPPSFIDIVKQNARNYEPNRGSSSRRISEPLRALTEEQLMIVTSSVLDVLLSYDSLPKLLNHLDQLEVTTRVSKESCIETGKKNNAIPILLNVLQECNQSLPHKKLCLSTLDILLNLAKFEETLPRGALAAKVIDIVSEKAKASLKDDLILSKSLTLIWMLIDRKSTISANSKKRLFDKNSILATIVKEAGRKKIKMIKKRKPNFIPTWISDLPENDQFNDKYVAAQALLNLYLAPADYTNFMKQHYSGIKPN